MFEDYMPQDAAAEIAVLAACFTSPVAAERTAKILSAEDFYSPDREAFYAAVATLRRQRKPVDPVTIGDLLRSTAPSAMALLPEVATSPTVPEDVEQHATIVRSCAVRRRLLGLTGEYRDKALSPETDAFGLLDSLAGDVDRLRTSQAEDITTLTLREILDGPDDPYDWTVRGLLERGDRLVLTGTEGGGKSTFLRQLGILPAAGLHPFRANLSTEPIRVHYIDCENSRRQTRRQMRALISKAKQVGDDPSDRVFYDLHGRMNLLNDRDLSAVHRSLAATRPDMVVIGPFYRLFDKAINTDDDAAPALRALDMIRSEHNVSLVIEAHSGHAKAEDGGRDVRPRGSSALLGWPEFGYGLRPHRDRDKRAAQMVELRHWRGDRDERDWPKTLGRGGIYPWTDEHQPNLLRTAN